MKNGKKIAVGLAAALAIAIFAGGAVSMVGASTTVELRVTVSSFDVDIEVGDTHFGDMLAGGTPSEIQSFTLTNNGQIAVQVEAKFLPEEEGGEEEVYGLYSCNTMEKHVIPAKNLRLNEIELCNEGEKREISTLEPVEEDKVHTAELTVPAGLVNAEYVGKIELIFSPVVA